MNIKNMFILNIIILFLITPFKMAAQSYNQQPPTPRVLFVIRKPDAVYLGGAEKHVVHCFKSLLKYGYQAWLFLLEGTVTETWLQKENLPYAKFADEKKLWADVKKAAKKKKIDVIMLDDMEQIPFANKITKRYKVKALYTEHATTPDIKRLTHLDAIITVNDITFRSINNTYAYKNRVTCIKPFFDEERFLKFKTHESKKSYFKKMIGLDIDPSLPILAAIGNINFDDYLTNKNYPLLFTVINDLVFNKKKPLHLMIAGSGIPQAVERLKSIVKKLDIEPYVHFFGRVTNIPQFLYHSDMHVIASTEESFGIANVEAGLMEKPVLGAYGTGAESIIVHNKTGFLFKNNNPKDLSDHIEILIDRPDLRAQFGIHGRHHVMNTLSNKSKIEALHAFLKKCMI